VASNVATFTENVEGCSICKDLTVSCTTQLTVRHLVPKRNNGSDETMEPRSAKLVAAPQAGLGHAGLDTLRCAQVLYPHLPAVQNAHYIKHNRITQGSLNEGDAIPEGVMLFSLDGKPAGDVRSYCNKSHSANRLPANAVGGLDATASGASSSSDVDASVAANAWAGGGRGMRPLIVAAGSYT
jgi:hypothetical protein